MNYLIPFLSALSFYLLPILTGRAIFGRIIRNKYSALTSLLLYYVAGVISLYSFTYFGLTVTNLFLPQVINPFSLRIVYSLFSVVIIILNILNISKPELTKKSALISLFVIILSVFVYAIWRFDSPYPNTLNWDIFEHQTVINAISQGKIAILPSRLTDTFGFDGYSTIFHVLSAIPQIIFKPDILGYWWFVEGLHLLTSVAVAGLLAWQFTRNRYITILSSVVSAFTFDSTIAFSNLLLIPQTLTAVVCAMAVSCIPDIFKKTIKLQVAFLIPVGIFMILTHFIIGSVACGLFILTLAISNLKIAKKSGLYTGLALSITCGLLLMTIFISKISNLSVINNGEAGAYIYSISQKITFLLQTYGLSMFILLPIGIFTGLKRNHNSLKILLFALVISIAIVMSPLPYVMKFYSLSRYYVCVLMAVGIWIITKNINSNILKTITTGVISSSLLIVFILNITIWKNNNISNGLASQVSGDEISASDFIKSKFDNSDLIVSDPSTQYILESLSGINSAGGAYMKKGNRQELDYALKSTNLTDFEKYTSQINDKLLLKPTMKIVVISDRTVKWLNMTDKEKYNYASNIWKPSIFSLYEYKFMDNFAQFNNLKLEYANDSLAVFTLPNKNITSL